MPASEADEDSGDEPVRSFRTRLAWLLGKKKKEYFV